MAEKPMKLADLIIEEVSLVDDPANPEARVLITKKSDPKVCPECGMANEPDAMTCKKCGYRMSKAADRPNGEEMSDLEKAKADLKAAEELVAEAQRKLEASEAKADALQKRLDAHENTPEQVEKRKLEALPKEYRERLEKAENGLRAMENERQMAVAVEKCKTFGNLPKKAEDFAPIYKKATAAMTADEQKEFDSMLAAASEALKKNAFEEKGRDGAVAGDVNAQFDALVSEIEKAEPKLKKAEAIAKAAKQNRALYDQYMAGARVRA